MNNLIEGQMKVVENLQENAMKIYKTLDFQTLVATFPSLEDFARVAMLQHFPSVLCGLKGIFSSYDAH